MKKIEAAVHDNKEIMKRENEVSDSSSELKDKNKDNSNRLLKQNNLT